MSMASKLQSPVKPVSEVRPVLGPTGNRVTRVSAENKGKTEALKKPPPRPRKPAASETAEMAVKNNLSVDSSCSTDSSSSSSSSSSSGSSVKVATSSARIVKRKGFRHSKAIPDGGQEVSPEQKGPVKRCDWITPNSDPIYTSFHDEEWGVPVRDDQKLFELLVFSQALAELSWPAILHMRDIFKELFDNFDPSSVAQFTEKKLLSLKVNGNLLLSEPKLRAIMVNAQQVLKVNVQRKWNSAFLSLSVLALNSPRANIDLSLNAMQKPTPFTSNGLHIIALEEHDYHSNLDSHWHIRFVLYSPPLPSLDNLVP